MMVCSAGGFFFKKLSRTVLYSISLLEKPQTRSSHDRLPTTLPYMVALSP